MSIQAEDKAEFNAAIQKLPQTMKGFFLNHLYEHGLFEHQSMAIFKKYEGSDLGKPMQGRWNEPTTNYSESLKGVIWMGLQKTAVQWIDENLPQHWAREMFVTPGANQTEKILAAVSEAPKPSSLAQKAFEQMSGMPKITSFNDLAVGYLTKNGLNKDDANAIIEAAKSKMESFKDRWDEDTAGHEAVTRNIFLYSIKNEASNWLGENKPEHWARAAFDQGPQGGTKPS